MEEETLVVRRVDRRVYRRFRQKALEENATVGAAVTDAMRDWINKKSRKTLNPKAILELDGIVKTAEKVRWSEEIDNTLYG